jgi:hypothetical protein
MIPESKQIVIDKSAFQGMKTNLLCDFANHYLLIAPGVLLYECATSEDRGKMKLLERYGKLIRAGACCCLMGRDFTQWEGWHCRPYPSCLAATEDMTERTVRGEVQLEKNLGPTDAYEWERSRTRGACAKYIELSHVLKQRVVQCCPNLRKEIKDFARDRPARLGLILSFIDKLDIHEMALRSFPSAWIRVPGEFCLSDEWVTWHRLRLGAAIAYEYWYKNQTGCVPKETTAEHDDQDAEYVLLLSRADAIITAERNPKEALVPHLARAAFPQKDVFSSLEEVPESYRCDWTNS